MTMQTKPPRPPKSGFGKEKTLADIRARIKWDAWAENEQRKKSHNALADGHALSRIAYQELLDRKGQKGLN